MLVYLVRHGIADPADPQDSDFDRPLSSKGIDRTKQAAKGLARLLDSPPSVLLTSPKARALQTAKIFGEHLAKKPVVLDALMHEDIQAINESLITQPAGSVMLIGHEPTLGEWAARWIFGPGAPYGCIQMKKSGCLLMHMDKPTEPHEELRGRLLWHLPPSVLRSAKS